MDFSDKKVCIIHALWHETIVQEFVSALSMGLQAKGFSGSDIDTVAVPGVLEIPLQALIRAKTGNYDIIVVTGLVADEGIYRHEFVAQAVIDGCMKAQMDTLVPVIHSVMTPQRFFEPTGDHSFFTNHFAVKGKEAVNAVCMTLQNMER